MSEGPPKPPAPEVESETRAETTSKERYIALAKEVIAKGERYSFPGIDPEAYARMKADDEEYPGYTTPIDELIARCRQEGVKVALSRYHPESGNVYILPAGSENIGQDSIYLQPMQLLLDGPMHTDLKELALLNKET